MNEFKGLYDIRDMQDEDKNFIRSTFLKGLYYGDSWFSAIPKQVFMDNYREVLEVLLTRAVIKVASPKDDSSIILGYSILSQDYQTVVWVYVKEKWRLKGIARSLVPKHPTSVAHLTRLGQSLLPKLEYAIFNPFKLF